MKPIGKTTRTSLIIAVIMFLVGGVLCISMYMVVHDSFFKITSSHEMELMKIMELLGSDLVDSKLNDLKQDAEELSLRYGKSLRDGGEIQQKKILYGTEQKTDRINYAFWTEDSLVCSNDRYKESVEVLDLASVLADDEARVFDPYFDEKGVYILSVAVPVKVGKVPVGVLVEQLDGFCMSRWLENMFSFMDAGTAYIVDSRDYNIAVAREENMDWVTSRYNAAQYAKENPTEENTSIAELEQRALDGELGVGTYLWDGGTSYVAYGKLNEADWGFYVGFYEEEFVTYTNQVAAISGRAGSMLIFTFMVFMGGIIAFILYNLAKERRYSSQLLSQKHEIEQQSQRIAASEERFRIAMGHTTDIILEYQVESGNVTCFYSGNEIMYKDYTQKSLQQNLIGGGIVLDDEAFHIFQNAFLTISQGMVSTECVLRAENGMQEKWFRMTLTSIMDIDGKPARAVGILKDITKEKNAEHDPLTGLLNKASMTSVVKKIGKQNHACGAFVMIDVDFFKRVNDTYGHLVGDKVLVRIAEIIREVFADDFYTGRFGGDEFCVACDHEFSKTKLAARLEQLGRSVREMEIEECGNPHVSCSCGAAFFNGGETYEEIYKRADAVLYEVKENGKNGYRFA